MRLVRGAGGFSALNGRNGGSSSKAKGVATRLIRRVATPFGRTAFISTIQRTESPSLE